MTGRYTSHYTNENHKRAHHHTNKHTQTHTHTHTHTQHTLLDTTHLHPSRRSHFLHSMIPPTHLLTRNTSFAIPFSHHACRALSDRITTPLEHFVGLHQLFDRIGRYDEDNMISYQPDSRTTSARRTIVLSRVQQQQHHTLCPAWWQLMCFLFHRMMSIA